MKINLKGMTRKELEKLKTDIDKALLRAEETEKKEALQAAEKAAKAVGYSLAELGDVATGKTSKAAKPKKSLDARAKVAPKYKNPRDLSQTWSGRGRKPMWVEAHLERGGSLNDILI
jgi:DNA-binding protein H-NS